MVSRGLATGLLIALVVLVGCKSEPSPAACKASGKVTVNGRPVAKVYVRFHLIGDPDRMAAPEPVRTEPDGSFALPLPVPGEYAVTAVWPVVTYTEPGEKGEELEGEDRLKGRYENANNPALKLTINAGENTIPPLDLKVLAK